MSICYGKAVTDLRPGLSDEARAELILAKKMRR
jgi:hypothetical protein